MRFGLVCFVLIFLGTEFFQWVAHLAWLSELELSLPLTLAGGIGLAIASNTRLMQSKNLPSNSSSQPSQAPQSMVAKPPKPVTPQPLSTPSSSSISFKIRKPFQS